MSIKTLVADDLTGESLTERSKTTVTVGDKSVEFDFGPKALAALNSWLDGEGTAKLSALLGTNADVKPARKTTRSKPATNSEDPEVIRAWARDNGVDVNVRGRVRKSVVEEYRKALASGPETADSGPETASGVSVVVSPATNGDRGPETGSTGPETSPSGPDAESGSPVPAPAVTAARKPPARRGRTALTTASA